MSGTQWSVELFFLRSVARIADVFVISGWNLTKNQPRCDDGFPCLGISKFSYLVYSRLNQGKQIKTPKPQKICLQIFLLIDLFNKINNLRKLKAKRKLPISEASLVRMVRQAGFEPTTPWFVARYSIQLSYWRTSDFSFVSVALCGEECVFYERKLKMQVLF